LLVCFQLTVCLLNSPAACSQQPAPWRIYYASPPGLLFTVSVQNIYAKYMVVPCIHVCVSSQHFKPLTNALSDKRKISIKINDTRIQKVLHKLLLAVLVPQSWRPALSIRSAMAKNTIDYTLSYVYMRTFKSMTLMS
jgi:hypothetical protein